MSTASLVIHRVEGFSTFEKVMAGGENAEPWVP